MSVCSVAVCDHCDLIIWPGEEIVSIPLRSLASIDLHKSCSEKSERGGFTTEMARKAHARVASTIRMP